MTMHEKMAEALARDLTGRGLDDPGVAIEARGDMLRAVDAMLAVLEEPSEAMIEAAACGAYDECMSSYAATLPEWDGTKVEEAAFDALGPALQEHWRGIARKSAVAMLAAIREGA